MSTEELDILASEQHGGTSSSSLLAAGADPSFWSNALLLVGLPAVVFLIMVACALWGNGRPKSKEERTEEMQIAVDRADPVQLRSKVIETLIPEPKLPNEQFLTYDSRAQRYICSKHTEGSRSCCICLETLDAEDCILEPQCGHAYHRTCILNWVQQLNRSNDCPYCRQPLWEDRAYYEIETAAAMSMSTQESEKERERQFYLDTEHDRELRRNRRTGSVGSGSSGSGSISMAGIVRVSGNLGSSSHHRRRGRPIVIPVAQAEAQVISDSSSGTVTDLESCESASSPLTSSEDGSNHHPSVVGLPGGSHRRTDSANTNTTSIFESTETNEVEVALGTPGPKDDDGGDDIEVVLKP